MTRRIVLLVLGLLVGVLAPGSTAATTAETTPTTDEPRPGVYADTPAPVRAVRCSARTPLRSRPGLRPGDGGSCVRTLQNLLLTKGYRLGRVWPGGIYHRPTRRAVKAFQAHAGLRVTGRINRAGWRALARAEPRLARYSWWRGPNRTPRVVLSFDDCPPSRAAFDRTTRAAERMGIALVLFPTGQCLGTGRLPVRTARARGHYVFNHSVSHPDLRRLSLAGVRRELGPPGVVTNTGRPPYGAVDRTAVKGYRAERMRIWLWTYDTGDWEGLSRDQVVHRVVANATAGSTMLMHMGWRGFDAAALRQMRRGLTQRGLRVCRNRPAPAPRAPRWLNC